MKGKQFPQVVVDFVLRRKRESPNLSPKQIADEVIAEFGTVVDKTTVGRWLAKEKAVLGAVGLVQVADPATELFKYSGSSAFFVVLKVESKQPSVRQLSATLTVEVQGRPVFPLNWAGKPYGPNEAEPVTMDPAPGTPARLDVAFAPVTTNDRITRSVIASGQIPEFLTTSGSPVGCWIAQPAALFHPDIKSPAYLPPGRHRVIVKIFRNGNEEVYSQTYLLTSPLSPKNLALKPVT